MNPQNIKTTMNRSLQPPATPPRPARRPWTRTHKTTLTPDPEGHCSEGEQLGKHLVPGQAVSVPCPLEGWTRAVVVTVEDGWVTLEKCDGQTVHLQASQVLLRSTDPDLAAHGDLTGLTPVNEATVLDCLHQRFNSSQLYTSAGSTIVAVNPFREVKGLYSNQAIVDYSYHRRGMGLPPHIYQLASKAYTDLVRGRGDQSIVVSGESGAGKTVSAKHLLRFLTVVACPDTHHSLNTSLPASAIERRVLDSNPILEAFGNASTPRNNNSSRFGKFIQLQFDRQGQVVGGAIRTYLLEKTRVMHQGLGEGNFHVFYQLSRLIEEPQLPPWLCEVKQEVIKASLLCLSPPCDTDPSFSSSDDPQRSSILRTVTALTDVGVTTLAQASIFKLLLAILHLSQLKFMDARDNDSSQLDKDVAVIEDASQWSVCEASRLLGVSDLDLQRVLLHRDIVSGRHARRSVYVKAVCAREARSRRDAMAMLLYSRVFEWLVSFINKQIKADTYDRSINLLDIYGFEMFGVNSLEQLCINYSNERLQQHYVAHFLRDLQLEYESECIPWVNISYYDNRPCVEALDGGSSVFSVFNEEVSLNRQSEDSLLCERVLASDPSCRVVHAPAQSAPLVFLVRHYAGPVTYSVEGMLHKNKDIIPPEVLDLLHHSCNAFLSTLMVGAGDMCTQGGATPTKAMKKKTVLTKFKSSLDALMSSLSTSDVHYIRCIKPNPLNMPGRFARPYVLQQLRACGSLETVDICRRGYPARMRYSEFVHRYKALLRDSPLKHHAVASNGGGEGCGNIDGGEGCGNTDGGEGCGTVDHVGLEFAKKMEVHMTCLKRRDVATHATSDSSQNSCALILARTFPHDHLNTMMHQFGLRKVFLSQAELEQLERHRETHLASCATLLQAIWRAWHKRCMYARLRSACVTLQAWWRGLRQCREYRGRRAAALVIQAQWRCQCQRQRFSAARHACVVIQTRWRGCQGRRRFMAARRAAVTLQAAWRGVCQRRTFDALKALAVMEQIPQRSDNPAHSSCDGINGSSVDPIKFQEKEANIGFKNHLNSFKQDAAAANDDDDDDNCSIMSDDSGVMIRDDVSSRRESTHNTLARAHNTLQGHDSLARNHSMVQGLVTQIAQGHRHLHVGDRVVTCRQLTKDGYRFHTRTNPLLPWAHVSHTAFIPRGLIDAL